MSKFWFGNENSHQPCLAHSISEKKLNLEWKSELIFNLEFLFFKLSVVFNKLVKIKIIKSWLVVSKAKISVK